MSLFQVVLNTRSLNSSRILIRKLARLTERDTRAEAVAWARERTSSIDEFCRLRSAPLWEETKATVRAIETAARSKLETIPFDLGGGGAYPLLYFLLREKQPEIVVETGVAAGWSSLTILEALKKNGHGRLYSSDFPYFRLPNPERFIGVLVPQDLRSSWSLNVQGDRVALPSIVKQVGQIDFFHYDSDKSYTGRKEALSVIMPRLADQATIIMDDIQDNVFFRDWVTQNGLEYTIFEFGGKYLGLIERVQ